MSHLTFSATMKSSQKMSHLSLNWKLESAKWTMPISLFFLSLSIFLFTISSHLLNYSLFSSTFFTLFVTLYQSNFLLAYQSKLIIYQKSLNDWFGLITSSLFDDLYFKRPVTQCWSLGIGTINIYKIQFHRQVNNGSMNLID